LLAALTGGLLLGAAVAVSDEAAQAKKKKKITICFERQTRSVKKKGWQDKYVGATKGACPRNPPQPLPQPVTREDASCFEPAGTTQFGKAGNGRLAQTFTALVSGKLVTAQVRLVKVAGSVGDYTASINTVANGFPTNTVLATTGIPNANAVNGESVATFNFTSNPASVVAGTTYALVISRLGTDTFTLKGSTSKGCLGGGFDSDTQSAAFFTMGAAVDLDYKTFVSS
jgi:hypothetical protein